LFCGKFNLTEEQFQHGLAAQDFQEVVDKDGRRVYCWNTVSYSVVQGKMEKQNSSGSKSLTNAQEALMHDAFDKIDFAVFQPAQLAIDGGTRLLSLQDRGASSQLNDKAWEEAEELLNQAKQAYDKLLKEAHRLHQQLGNNKGDNLWSLLLLVF